MENFPEKPSITAIGTGPLISDPVRQLGIRMTLGIVTIGYFYFAPVPILAMARGWIFGIALAYLLYHAAAWRFYTKKGATSLGIRIGNWVDIIGSGMAVILDPYAIPPTLMLVLIVIIGNGIQNGLDNFTIEVRKGILAAFLCVILHFLLHMKLPPYPYSNHSCT